MRILQRFFRSRGVRKLARNRLAMFALAIVLFYGVVAAAILLFRLVPLEATRERVGPQNLPGFFANPSPERRLEHADYYLGLLLRQLKEEDPARALRSIALAERRVVDKPLAEIRDALEKASALYEDMVDRDELYDDAQVAAVIPDIERLESMVDSLFVVPADSSTIYSMRLLFGTDRQGRSIFMRAIYSVKVAVQVGAVVALVSVILGSFLGAAAAFFGGWVDHAVIWLYSTFSAIPSLVLLLVLVYMFTDTFVEGTIYTIYCAFCMTFWIGPCRVVRGETLRLKELEYVQAAKTAGFGRFYILLRHVLPNTAHLMFINFSLLFIGAIKSEVILSFLGLGIKNEPSWGIMINQSRPEVINGFFWQIGAATAFMFVLVLAFNILTDALQDAFDPKHLG